MVNYDVVCLYVCFATFTRGSLQLQLESNCRIVDSNYCITTSWVYGLYFSLKNNRKIWWCKCGSCSIDRYDCNYKHTSIKPLDAIFTMVFDDPHSCCVRRSSTKQI